MGGSLLIWLILVLVAGVINYALGWYRYQRISCVMVLRRLSDETVFFGRIGAVMPASFAMVVFIILFDAIPSFVSHYSALQYFGYLLVVGLTHGVILYWLTKWLEPLGEIRAELQWGKYRYLKMTKCPRDIELHSQCPFAKNCFRIADSKQPNCERFVVTFGNPDAEVIIKTSADPDDVASSEPLNIPFFKN